MGRLRGGALRLPLLNGSHEGTDESADDQPLRVQATRNRPSWRLLSRQGVQGCRLRLGTLSPLGAAARHAHWCTPRRRATVPDALPPAPWSETAPTSLLAHIVVVPSGLPPFFRTGFAQTAVAGLAFST